MNEKFNCKVFSNHVHLDHYQVQAKIDGLPGGQTVMNFSWYVMPRTK
jgi:hypothetical protein